MVKKLPVSIKGHADTQRKMEWKVLCLGCQILGLGVLFLPLKRTSRPKGLKLDFMWLGWVVKMPCAFLHVSQDKPEHSCM